MKSKKEVSHVPHKFKDILSTRVRHVHRSPNTSQKTYRFFNKGEAFALSQKS